MFVILYSHHIERCYGIRYCSHCEKSLVEVNNKTCLTYFNNNDIHYIAPLIQFQQRFSKLVDITKNNEMGWFWNELWDVLVPSEYVIGAVLVKH
jgi:hypothetical protein